MSTQTEVAKHVGDVTAITVTLGTIVEFLPALAALFTIVWTGLRIYEMFKGEGSVAKWLRKK